jgi:hypothetical protein
MLYLQTDSRLAFYLSVFGIIGGLIIKKYPVVIKNSKLIKRLLALSFIICSSISLLLIFNYNDSNKTMKSMDDVLENRLSLGNASLEKYDINLFGNDVNYVGAGLGLDGTRAVGDYDYVDCLYLNMIEKFGLVYYISYLIIMTCSQFILKRKGFVLLLFLISIYALMGMIDDLSIYLHYNSFLFVIGSLFIPDSIKQK